MPPKKATKSTKKEKKNVKIELETVEEIYEQKEHREHILDLPDSYIGSVKKTDAEMFLYDEKDAKMFKKEIRFIPGLYKIFDEIVVNARDHYIRINEKIAEQKSKKGKKRNTRNYKPVKNISVSIDIENNQIEVRNDGDGVPVEWHKDAECYVPTLIFSRLLTSTNYKKDEERIVGGRNGYGAKLANIYSTEFEVETLDHYTGKKFYQKFSNNMDDEDEPVIEDHKGNPYTLIRFKPDLSRFGLKKLNGDDTVALMKKRVVDIAAVTGADVTVTLNNTVVPIKTFERYVDLYVGSKSACTRVFAKVNDRWEIAVCSSTDDKLEQVSFVNGICTYKGGKHIDHVVNGIAGKLCKLFESKKGKNKGMIKVSHIKENMWVFVNSTIVNPSFDAQTKGELTTNVSEFGSKCDLSEDIIKKIAKLDILERAERFADFKNSKTLEKNQGTKKSKIDIPKLLDATYAGHKTKSKDCAIIFTEGDSAKSMAVAGFGAFDEEKRKYFGAFPLRGKIQNTCDMSAEKAGKNQYFNDIMKIMGLKYRGVYTKDNSWMG